MPAPLEAALVAVAAALVAAALDCPPPPPPPVGLEDVTGADVALGVPCPEVLVLVQPATTTAATKARPAVRNMGSRRSRLIGNSPQRKPRAARCPVQHPPLNTHRSPRPTAAPWPKVTKAGAMTEAPLSTLRVVANVAPAHPDRAVGFPRVAAGAVDLGECGEVSRWR